MCYLLFTPNFSKLIGGVLTLVNLSPQDKKKSPLESPTLLLDWCLGQFLQTFKSLASVRHTCHLHHIYYTKHDW